MNQPESHVHKMNFNSANQTWSRWTITVRPKNLMFRSMDEVRENTSRFFRKGFGSATQMRLHKEDDTWTFDLRSEGHPVQDPDFCRYMTQQIGHFFLVGFGVGTETTVNVKLEAGSAQDGTPSAQLLVLPSVIGDL